jgi:hypothetical protein
MWRSRQNSFPAFRLIRFRFSRHIDQLAIQVLKCVQGLGAGGQVSLRVLVRPQPLDKCGRHRAGDCQQAAYQSTHEGAYKRGIHQDRLPSRPESRPGYVDEVRQNY